MHRCPVCGSRALGKLSNKQFYCWDCCVEFLRSPKGLQIFLVLDDGSLENLSLEEARKIVV